MNSRVSWVPSWPKAGEVVFTPSMRKLFSRPVAPPNWKPVVSVAAPDPVGYDLVINATPLGLDPGDPLAFDVARLDAGASVVDILMKNQPTPLLRACEARGIRAYPGFEMLIQQVPEYLSFFGMADISRKVAADLSGVRALFGA